MVTDFHLVLALAGFGVFAAAPMIIIPLLFAPRKPGPVKNALYESGQVPVGDGRVSIMMQYYAYILIFIIFDVAVMFLFAWAISYSSIGINSFFLILAFLGILFIPISYTLILAGRTDLW